MTPEFTEGQVLETLESLLCAGPWAPSQSGWVCSRMARKAEARHWRLGIWEKVVGSHLGTGPVVSGEGKCVETVCQVRTVLLCYLSVSVSV